MTGKNTKPPVKVILEGRIDTSRVFDEVNRLRASKGLEEYGTLALATKVFRHFHESHNPRVEEALRNTGHVWCCIPEEKPGKAASGPARTAPATTGSD